MTNIILSTAPPTTLMDAADANFVVHASWAPQRTYGMQVLAGSGLVLIDSGLACDTFNSICRTRLEANEATERIRQTIAYFNQVGRPFSWWVGPADQPANLGNLLVGVGLHRAESELAMAIDLATLQDGYSMPNGLEIRRAHTHATLQDFARIVSANWTPPDPAVLHFYELTASALTSPDAPQWLYVGYLANQPVATAELTVGGGVVGLYNICTLAAYRRRGIGTAMTLHLLRDARNGGFQTGVLQAAVAGVGLYTRLGFRQFGNITEYQLPRF